MLPADAASVDRAGTIMKTETERHMLPRSTSLGMTVTAALILAAAAAPVQADPQNIIGLQEASVNGGAITIYTGPPGAYGTFGTNNSSTANPGNIAPTPTLPLLSGDTIDVSNASSGTLVVWMTTTGNLGANLPLGTHAFQSSFTDNLLPDGWTVQVDTFLDPADGIFTTAIPLSSHLFRGSDPAFRQTVQADPGNGFFSVTARFTITANGAGSVNSTADIAFVAPHGPDPVPGPMVGAGLPGFILASGGHRGLCPSGSTKPS
jgi:hypothetical protein